MANTYEEFLSQSGYTPRVTTYDSSTPDIPDDTFVRILNKESVNNTPENRLRILDMWASQRARREANAKPTTYESTTVEAFTPFYSPRIGYAGSNVSGNFTNTNGWVSGGSTPVKPEVSSATPIQDLVAKLNTNFLYGKPFFHIEKPSLYYPYANKYNPGNGIIPFSALMQPSSNASVQSDVLEEAILEAAPKLTFKQAFALARKNGLSEFEWNGGKYNTALKSNTSVLPSTPAKPRAPWESNIMAAAPSNNTEVLPGASSVGLDPNNLSNTRTKEENLEILKKQAEANYVAPTNTVSSAALTKEMPTEQWRSYSYEKQLELRKQGYYPKGDLVQGWKNFVSGLKQYTNRRINTSIPTSYRPIIRR